MKYHLRTKGDPILKTICKKVTAFDDDLKVIVASMRCIMLENQGLGLAAPQIGVAEQIIIVRKQLKKGIWTVINPEITGRSTYENLGKEGCLSYPGVEREISRPNAIVISGFDNKGRKITIKAEGLEARIFCHELDHLKGHCSVGILIKEEKEKKKYESHTYSKYADSQIGSIL